MFRTELSRIYELSDLVPKPHPSDFYFKDIEKLGEIPQQLRQFRDLERDLQSLEESAWNFLKSELTPLLSVRDTARGWQALFDMMNLAKAYRHLKTARHEKIEFIPRSIIKGQQTPDLRSQLDSANVLCEVKTINISEVEAERRVSGGVGTTAFAMGEGFFRKLESDLTQAKKQMLAFDPRPTTKKVVYVIVNFDDLLHELVDIYRTEIDNYLVKKGPFDLQVILDIKPAFYAAMG